MEFSCFTRNSCRTTLPDGFRQDPAFYYFTGLANTVGAILAIDGRSRESWLFLPTHVRQRGRSKARRLGRGEARGNRTRV